MSTLEHFDPVPAAPQAAAIVVGFFLVLFALYSAVIKERLYLSEALVTTTIGTLVGPNVTGLFPSNLQENSNEFLLEFSRLVVAVQIMAAVINLPIQYYRFHWRSIFILVAPVMMFSWLTSATIVWFLAGLNFCDSLIVGALLAPTDPILANSIVRGKFAEKHVSLHIRNLLSGESACNDATAAVFFNISLRIREVVAKKSYYPLLDFLFSTILYEICVSVIFGSLVGYAARKGLLISKKREFIDEENFLSFAIAIAIFTNGTAAWLRINDIVAVLVAAVAFSWDDQFFQETRESHIQEVLDNLVNAVFFVFLGTILPWKSIGSQERIGEYFAVAVLVLVLHRMPFTLAFYPWLPSLTTRKEALFVGHFGPIAVGTMFYLALLRHEQPDFPGANLVMFIVFCSIVVHGVTVPLFKVGSVAVRTISASNAQRIATRCAQTTENDGSGSRQGSRIAKTFVRSSTTIHEDAAGPNEVGVPQRYGDETELLPYRHMHPHHHRRSHSDVTGKRSTALQFQAPLVQVVVDALPMLPIQGHEQANKNISHTGANQSQS